MYKHSGSESRMDPKSEETKANRTEMFLWLTSLTNWLKMFNGCVIAIPLVANFLQFC
jgi:hypothetical protein